MSDIIRFRKINPAAIIPTYKTTGSVGMDLHIIGQKDSPAKDLVIPAGQTVIARTGLSISYLPMGLHAEIVLRSSTPIKHPGLIMANHIGIIDEDYCGPEDEIYIVLRNTSNQDTKIKIGERIAQLILRPTVKVLITELPYEVRLHDGDRPPRSSRGGLGSTG